MIDLLRRRTQTADQTSFALAASRGWSLCQDRRRSKFGHAPRAFGHTERAAAPWKIRGAIAALVQFLGRIDQCGHLYPRSDSYRVGKSPALQVLPRLVDHGQQKNHQPMTCSPASSDNGCKKRETGDAECAARFILLAAPVVQMSFKHYVPGQPLSRSETRRLKSCITGADITCAVAATIPHDPLNH